MSSNRLGGTEKAPLADDNFRLLVESVSDYAIYIIDTRGIIRSWNTGARRIKGYEAGEIIGRHLSFLYPAELQERKWAGPDTAPARGAVGAGGAGRPAGGGEVGALRPAPAPTLRDTVSSAEHALQVAAETGHFEEEAWRMHKDGSRFWAHVTITKLVDTDGNPRGFAKITRDLTDRRRHEQKLRESEERFRLLVEGVKDYAIFMLDPSGHVISWNTGAELTKGYLAGEIIGRHFSTFYPQEAVASGWPDEALKLALSAGRFEDEGWRIRKDGSRFWASVVITALLDDSGRHCGFAKVTRDLTAHRRIRALEDEGRRIATFLAMLGHELRAPLAPIANALSIMDLDRDPEDLRMARDVIVRQTRQMARLVDDLLDVGRITSGKIRLESRPVKLSDALTQAIESAEPLVRAKCHTLQMQLHDPELWVGGDRARLVQIVSNLLVNAAKFTQPNGRIVLELRASGTAHAQISVKDNGPGIAPDLLPRVFDLFVQGEQNVAHSQGGLGLGLSLVHQLVSLHGGEISAFSSGRPGAGTEFVILLPTIPEPRQPLPSTQGMVAGARQSILVVDDNRDAADTLALLLRSLGYRSAACYDGRSAIEAVRTERPEVVLLDVGLPGLSGLDVARTLRAGSDPPHLIAVTGFGQERDRQASSNAGFAAHMIKPLNIDNLAQELNRLLGTGGLDL